MMKKQQDADEVKLSGTHKNSKQKALTRAISNHERQTQMDTLHDFVLLGGWKGIGDWVWKWEKYDLLRIIVSESQNQNWPEVKRLLLEFPKFKRKDVLEMLRRGNNDKDFPDEIFW